MQTLARVHALAADLRLAHSASTRTMFVSLDSTWQKLPTSSISGLLAQPILLTSCPDFSICLLLEPAQHSQPQFTNYLTALPRTLLCAVE